MKLGALLNSSDSRPVTGFAIDHLKVAPGNIFGAFQGAKVNGEDYIDAAIAAGALRSSRGPMSALRARSILLAMSLGGHLRCLPPAFLNPFRT